jgi:hypothetical protein
MNCFSVLLAPYPNGVSGTGSIACPERNEVESKGTTRARAVAGDLVIVSGDG